MPSRRAGRYLPHLATYTLDAALPASRGNCQTVGKSVVLHQHMTSVAHQYWSAMVLPNTTTSSYLRSGPPHTVVDDMQAGLTSVVLVSLGLALLNSAGLMTGGAPGLALLLSYATGLRLGLALFLVNMPFYVLAWKGIGPRFTLKTAAAVTALSIGVEIVRRVVMLHAPPAYAALAGGILIGTGLLVMFRHDASFGGVNILALYLHERVGWTVGRTQMAIDAVIFASAFIVMDVNRVAWSTLGAVAVNAVLLWNHRPGRYRAAAGRRVPDLVLDKLPNAH